MIYSLITTARVMVSPDFNKGDFFCWENMAWVLLILIWLAGFLLCCRGFKKGGKLSFQIFLTGWTIYAVNIRLNKIFSANESLFYFTVLYTVSWILLFLFRILMEHLAPLSAGLFQSAPAGLKKIFSILCGMFMIASVYGTEISNPLLILSLILAGSIGWWSQSREHQKPVPHFTYRDLDALEKRVLALDSAQRPQKLPEKKSSGKN